MEETRARLFARIGLMIRRMTKQPYAIPFRPPFASHRRGDDTIVKAATALLISTANHTQEHATKDRCPRVGTRLRAVDPAACCLLTDVDV
jgi:hypothetical protein